MVQLRQVGRPESALKNMDEIIAVAAIRKIRDVNQSILDSISDIDVGKKTVSVISREDTVRAINALEKLRSMKALEGRTFPVTSQTSLRGC